MQTDLGMRAPARAGTVGAALREAEALLVGACDVTSPACEARELLAALLDQPRWWPALNGKADLSEPSRRALVAAVSRRAAGAPMAYAVGRVTFRHLALEIDDRVLIPRPETETLVDLVLERARQGGTAVDVGTGSGCIALALASEGRFTRVIGTDVSLDALAVAGRNVARHAAALRSPVELRHGSLLDPLHGERVGVVVSNPPYVAIGEAAALPRDVRDWEPPLALYSPGHGTAITERLVRQASDVLEEEGLLAIEVDSRRAALVAGCVAARGHYKDVSVMLDLTGRERFVVARRARRRRGA